MDELTFEPLPPQKRGGRVAGAWVAQAAALRVRPGEWALIRRGMRRSAAGGLQSNISGGNLAAFRPKGSFEAATRVVDGEVRVYARYVGNGDGE